MMNALRLNEGVPAQFYKERTGYELDKIQAKLDSLRQRHLFSENTEQLACTAHGHLFLNSVLEEFL